MPCHCRMAKWSSVLKWVTLGKDQPPRFASLFILAIDLLTLWLYAALPIGERVMHCAPFVRLLSVPCALVTRNSHYFGTQLRQGRLSPNNRGALPPILTSPPFSPPPPPQTIIGHFIQYAILCNFMRVFSEFWKLAVSDNDTKNGKRGKLPRWGLGWSHSRKRFLDVLCDFTRVYMQYASIIHRRQ